MNEANNFIAEIQKMGRLTVPYETREFLNLAEGDLIVIEIKEIKHRQKQEASAQ